MNSTALVFLLAGIYLIGYGVTFFVVWRLLERAESDPSGNIVSAIAMALLWPAWLPGVPGWWLLRGRRLAAQRRAEGNDGPDVEVWRSW